MAEENDTPQGRGDNGPDVLRRVRELTRPTPRATYVTEKYPAGDDSEFHITYDDPSRSKLANTLCSKGITINGSQDTRPKKVCEECSEELERRLTS
jgi:hypothetical protein